MHIEDLSTHAWFIRGERVRAVGWLEAGHDFSRGAVPDDFFATLAQHVAHAFGVIDFMGSHTCSLCPAGTTTTGIANLMVPSQRFLYVAPELVLHYVEAHGYRPPVGFIQAVMTCPAQGSPEYLEKLARLRPFGPGAVDQVLERLGCRVDAEGAGGSGSQPPP